MDFQKLQERKEKKRLYDRERYHDKLQGNCYAIAHDMFEELMLDHNIGNLRRDFDQQFPICNGKKDFDSLLDRFNLKPYRHEMFRQYRNRYYREEDEFEDDI